jgi:hypothetical protein
MVGPGRSLPVSEDGLVAAQFLHHARGTVIRDQSRTMLYAGPLKDGCSRRNVGNNLNAIVRRELLLGRKEIFYEAL